MQKLSRQSCVFCGPRNSNLWGRDPDATGSVASDMKHAAEISVGQFLEAGSGYRATLRRPSGLCNWGNP